MAHWERVDLNLLAPLAALLEEKHVSRAAARAHLSQPAMSRALARLRDTLDDELLVRGHTGYQLTPRAERLQRQLAAVLPRLDVLFTPEVFDPRSATETFRLAGTDYPITVFGPALFRRVVDQAPQSTLTFSAWHPAVFDDLERGAVDVVFFGVAPPQHLCTRHLFTEPFVCVLSANHPLAARRRLSLQEYLDCAHVVVDVHDGTQTAVDRQLAALGAHRRPALQVPYHSTAAPAVVGTHLVATLPERLLTDHGNDPTLRLVRPPAEIEPMRYWMAWHARVDDDPAQRWLRATIQATTDSVYERPEPESTA
ncbi:LysR family transcriptional regulator [Pseudonocardia xinjiangensis]|uniref:LysR family transcriptional regulator n=1 Tax=Pseudonocardia xinjiangensis TaxID=75289 RepID=UPI003D8F92AE